MKINAIVLAAGESKRFGSHKLMQSYKGQTVLGHLLNKLEQVSFDKVYVITSKMTEEIVKSKENTFKTVLNIHPEEGISSSIRLGLEASEECEAYCFIVADQIALEVHTVQAMLRCYRQNPQGILRAAFKEQLGNPVIFHKKYKQELMQLEGDVGGKKVLKAHLEEVVLFEVDHESELIDIDTQKDWNRLLMEESSWNN